MKTNEYYDSSNIGAGIINAMAADQGDLRDSESGRRLLKGMAIAAENFVRKNPKLKITLEDLQEIVGGDIDEVNEKYGKYEGWEELNEAIDNYVDGE